MDTSLGSLAATLLRDPQRIVDEARNPATFAAVVPRLLGITVVGAALVGLVVGSYRGGIQVAYAALKMPLLFGVPLVVGLPAARAMFEATGAEVPWSRMAVAGLAGTARTAVLAAALGPALWLSYSLSPGYHLAVLQMAVLLVVSGLPGLATVARALPASPHRFLAGAGALLVLGAITAQSGWLLRPFVARPNAEVTLFRPVEGDVFASLLRVPLASLDVYVDYEPERKRVLGVGSER